MSFAFALNFSINFTRMERNFRFLFPTSDLIISGPFAILLKRIFRYHGGSEHHDSRRHLATGGIISRETNSGAHSFGQWAGVYGESDSAVAKRF